MTETAPARTPREPATLSTLLAWRRSGLVLCGLAVGCSVGGLAAAVADLDVVTAVLFLVAFVTVVIGYGFLQRALSDPLVAEEPRVALIRRWVGVASVAWSLTFVVRLVVWVLPDDLEPLRWVGLPFGVAGIVAYAGVLVLAARWRPGRV